MNFTPQGGAIEGNAADDILMMDQGAGEGTTFYGLLIKPRLYPAMIGGI